jgi:hypothetical protein
MALALPVAEGWALRAEPVGDVSTLIARLRAHARDAPVALGVDFPIGLPRAYVARHLGTCLAGPPPPGFPGFLSVCGTLNEVGPARPFYPMHGVRGITRLSHAQALGLDSAADLSRACDMATPHRPAGAPLFWTLGANQTGKAAIAAWRDLLLPALAGPRPPALWPFDGALLPLLAGGKVVLAETYPAEAMRQLGLRMGGSKRRHADRIALMPALRLSMAALSAAPDPALDRLMTQGFGPNAAGEDRMDCVLGLLCVLQVLTGRRTDAAPDDPWIRRWEGWVLGQTA